MSEQVNMLRKASRDRNTMVFTEYARHLMHAADHLAATEQRLAEVEAKYATLLERVRLYANKQGVNMPNNKISKTLEKCVVPRLRFHGSTSMAGKLADDIERLNQLVQAAKYAISCYDNGSGMAVPIDELRNALRNIELESEPAQAALGKVEDK